MRPSSLLLAAAGAALLLLAGCATRPINPPLAKADPHAGYRYETRRQYLHHGEDLVILAFSGGGTRAAAFAYGVLEVLRDIEVIGSDGARTRMLDQVDIITGVSGGSFTALAYGLYGERLFAEYESRFLKRDVQGTLARRLINPVHSTPLLSPHWGRSELAAELYDEVLFEGATFADLQRGHGPMVVAAATDLSTGARFYFNQFTFDVLCSDLLAVPLSRAAAASSSVPVLFSPVTINNYGGSCGYREPAAFAVFAGPGRQPRPAARAIQRLKELRTFEDGKARPFVHLVDGGVSDNLGIRGVLDAMEQLEALRLIGRPSRLDRVRRIVIFVVNSLSTPPLDWDARESPPSGLDVLLKATGVPIDHYSYEGVELIRDTAARWKLHREVRLSGNFAGADNTALAEVLEVPDVDVHVVDVSFAALGDPAERDYLNRLPTSFVLSPEAVDRLRAAAGAIVLESVDFRQYLQVAGDRIVKVPAPAGKPAPPPR